MDNAQSLIQIYNTIFYICIAVAVLALAGAIAMFFLFDIRTNFLMRTNRAQQISINKIKEKNSKTGPIGNKPAVDMDFTSGDLYGVTGETPLTSSETEALSGQTMSKSGALKPATQPAEPVTPSVRFDIIEDTVVIHTDEVICSAFGLKV